MRERAYPASSDVFRWVERIALYFVEVDRLPLIAGRVLGWLMISDPPDQSAEQIAGAIGASRASLSTNLRLLTSVGLVRMGTRPGQRTRYFRIEDEAWEAVVRSQVASLVKFTQITGEGLELLGPESPRAGRIRAAHDIFIWMKAIFDAAPPPASVRKTRENKK